MLSLLKKIYRFFVCLLIFEKKTFINQIKYLFFFFRNIEITNYFLYIFNKNNINPIKSKKFKKYIIKNKNLWNNFYNKKEKKDILLIENFINHPSYSLSNIISACYLKKILNCQLTGILRQGDIKCEILFRSFGVKEFIILKNPNFFQRIIYIIKALKILKNKQKIKSFCNIKYKNIEVGISSYDTFIRYTGIASLNIINSKLITILAECIYFCDIFEKILFNNKNIKYSVQSETVFNPLNSFFQICLKKKLNIFARCGEDKISLRHYNNWSQRHEYRYNISQKIFNNFYRKNNFNKIFQKTYNYKIKNNKFGVDSRITNFLKKKQENINKKEFVKKFNLKNKKIIVFFMNHLIDRNFHHGPRLNFQDNYSWTKFILKYISKDNNFNWIIKPHPTEFFYNSKKNFNLKIIELAEKNNVVLYPTKFKSSSLLKIADFALTSHGTVGVEYPAFGIDSFFVENSFYSKMDFFKKIPNKKEIISKLKKINSLKKISKIKIYKCRALLIMQQMLILNNCSLIPKHTISRKIDEDNFWYNSQVMTKNFNIEKDLFYNMLKLQLKYKLRHTLNFTKFEIDKKIYKDY